MPRADKPPSRDDSRAKAGERLQTHLRTIANLRFESFVRRDESTARPEMWCANANVISGFKPERTGAIEITAQERFVIFYARSGQEVRSGLTVDSVCSQHGSDHAGTSES